MTEQIFSYLAEFMESSFPFVIAGSFLWGAASILLSPCHLASIPLIVGYISGQHTGGVRKGLLVSVVFSLGIFAVLLLIGGTTILAGRILGDIGRPVSLALSVLLVCVGLYIAGAIRLPGIGRGLDRARVKHGYRGAFIIGVLFGAGLGPCAFAFMIPVLSAAFSSAGATPLYSALLVVMYAVGHCALIVIAGSAAGAVAKWLSFGESSVAPRVIRAACGILVILSGFYLAVKTW